MTADKPNVIPGAAQIVDRPANVPASAQWVNGMWYVNSRPWFDPDLNPRETPAARQARIVEEQRQRERDAREGLPNGFWRNGGVIRNSQGKVAVELPGGYIADGRHRPDYEDKRARRIEGIKAAAAALAQANVDLQIAIQKQAEAEAAFGRAQHVEID